MKLVDTMPTEGQFVMVNDFEGNIWGTTYRYNDGKLEFLDVTVNVEDKEVEDDVVIPVATPADIWVEVSDFAEQTENITILGYVVA